MRTAANIHQNVMCEEQYNTATTPIRALSK